MNRNEIHFVSPRTGYLMMLSALFFMPLRLCLAADMDTPDDYFHGGARHYIDSELEAAKTTVEKGWEVYPSDPKLGGLKELLKQQEEQQQQQDDQQDDDRQDPADRQDSDDQQQRDEEDTNENEDVERGEDEAGRQQEEEHAQEEPEAGEMSREEAEMLLDAMKQDEQAEREKMRIMLGEPQSVDRDW